MRYPRSPQHLSASWRNSLPSIWNVRKTRQSHHQLPLPRRCRPENSCSIDWLNSLLLPELPFVAQELVTIQNLAFHSNHEQQASHMRVGVAGHDHRPQKNNTVLSRVSSGKRNRMQWDTTKIHGNDIIDHLRLPGWLGGWKLELKWSFTPTRRQYVLPEIAYEDGDMTVI